MLARPFVTVLRGWRRSLQVRVVTATMVLSAIVVVLVGALLQGQIVEGVLTTKESSAVAEAYRGFEEAQRALDEETLPGSDAGQSAGVGLVFGEIVSQLSTRSGGGERFEIVVLGSKGPGDSITQFSPRATGVVRVDSVPNELIEMVAASTDPWQVYHPITFAGVPTTTELGFMIGTTLRSGDDGVYELYYLFPLDQEEATLALVQRTLFTASAMLLVLIGVIAWFVVHQTVTPVRLAARIAERLAAGGLQERMHVRGEDDLARLATSFNKMATNLERQIKQLEDLSRMQQRFVSDVSHELRTPLTTVRMAADVLHEARPQLNPAAARSAELLQKELDRFESLLGELLEISRFDAGVAVLEPEEVDCRELARQATTSLGALAERAGIELVLDLPARPCLAEVDPRRIDRILRNLVANAIEHGERRPVQVTVGADDRTVAFTVRDHGVGLRPGEAASVFNRFWRADPARTRTTGGTGLGLAISLEDTHLHGGWLQAWGRPGLGSQFRLTLPRELGGAVESSPLPMVPTPVVGPSARRPAAPAVAGGHRPSSTNDELATGSRRA
ncbi:MAG: MtrAB system histidine kinase MtrB [Actinomycetes bacterium]